jgi:hypothetical protein
MERFADVEDIVLVGETKVVPGKRSPFMEPSMRSGDVQLKDRKNSLEDAYVPTLGWLWACEEDHTNKPRLLINFVQYLCHGTL